MNEKENTFIGGDAHRLPTLSGAGTAFPDSEGDSVAPKRRGNSAGDESERIHQPISRRSLTPNEQFINDRCTDCNHSRRTHFEEHDEIGAWMFCVLETCECFKDWRADDDA